MLFFGGYIYCDGEYNCFFLFIIFVCDGYFILWVMFFGVF